MCRCSLSPASYLLMSREPSVYSTQARRETEGEIRWCQIWVSADSVFTHQTHLFPVSTWSNFLFFSFLSTYLAFCFYLSTPPTCSLFIVFPPFPPPSSFSPTCANSLVAAWLLDSLSNQSVYTVRVSCLTWEIGEIVSLWILKRPRFSRVCARQARVF